jgi:hypothetical protein
MFAVAVVLRIPAKGSGIIKVEDVSLGRRMLNRGVGLDDGGSTVDLGVGGRD